jgi:hypothetical protein
MGRTAALGGDVAMTAVLSIADVKTSPRSLAFRLLCANGLNRSRRSA